MEEATRRRLLSRGLLAPDDWLNTCANNFRSSDTYAPGQDKLEEYVFQEWLLVDLSELRVSSFPPNLENQLKVTLNGRYTCQVVSVIDIGHSAYSQYQKIRKDDTDNLSVDETDKFQSKWEPKSSRTLLISITDSAQQLVAQEFYRIPSLSTNLIPGCKAVIKGPVTCRRGFIMLEKQQQIEILGGKVESFLIPNAYENILGLNLGLPVNENAHTATGAASDELPEQENLIGQRNNNMLAENRQNSAVPSHRARPPPRPPVQRNRPAPPPHRTLHTLVNANWNIQQTEDDFPDDDALLSIDIENVVAMEEQSAESSQSARFTNLTGQSRLRTDTGERPHVSHSRSNKPPSKPPTPTYDVDIDEDLLNEFAYDLDEAAFSQPEPSTSAAEERRNPNSTVGNSGSTRKDSESSIQPSKTIDNWLKPNQNIDSVGTTAKRRVSAPSGNPSKTFLSSRTPNAGNPYPAQISAEPVSQDSGCPDDDDIVCLEDKGLNRRNEQTQKNVGNKPQNNPTRDVRQTEYVPANLADVVEVLSKGTYDQPKSAEVKVRILRVVQSLNIRNDEWTMVVEINDSSASLEVSMSSEVITKIFGLTPAEGARRRKAAVTDLAAREDLKKEFRRLETKLKTLDSIFELFISPGQKPRVVNIQDKAQDLN